MPSGKPSAEGWTWRVGDAAASSRMRLRYEPGGWGDVLKGIFAAEVAFHLHEAGARPLRFADPFAGAPDYPIVAATAERLAAAQESRFGALVRGHGGGRLPSTASVLLAACEGDAQGAVFDADASRRAAWAGHAGVTVIDAANGIEALRPEALGPRDLVVVDPYDLDRREIWSVLLPLAARLRATGSHLLLYLFHRQSRPPDLATYRAFREAIERLAGPPALVGRVPSDRLLPRAWHEVLLVPGITARAPITSRLVERLGDATRALGFAILAPGLVERAEAPLPPGSG